MRHYKRLILVTVSGLLLSGCSAGRSNFNAAQGLEKDGRFEEAMYKYAEAFKADPEQSQYRLGFIKSKDAAAAARSKRGDELYAAGNFADAVTEYQTASGLDGGQGRYAQKADRAAQMRDAKTAWQEGMDLEKGNKLKDAANAYARAMDLAPKNAEYRAAAQRVAALRKSSLDGYELHLKSNRPITLKFRDARLKDVFGIVTQLSGINFIFDEGVKDQNITIQLENATFYQAMDLLTGMNKLGRKTLNESTVIVYPKTTEKTKQYEDMLVRTFHLNNLDAKKAVNLIRSIVQVRKLYVNEETNALVLRDTAEVAAVVEKILEANDVPEPEVVLDVEVVEITDKNAYDLGLLLSPYSVSMAGFKPSGEMLAPSLYKKDLSDPVGLNQLVKAFGGKGFGGYVTVPNGQYNFGKTLAKGDILSNPKIRIKNREKAKFNVGTRVPITTTSSTGTVTNVNVQYIDVGVKVNAEPVIQLNNEISIRLSLEVSQAGPVQKVGSDGATQVVDISTRNLDTVLTLKDGETSIIGGLIERQDNFSKKSIIGIGDIPVIGSLLSDNVSDKRKTELMLAITPRLIRGVTVPSAKLASFGSGKEDDPTLNRPYASFDLDPEYEGEQKKKVQPDTKAPVTTLPGPVSQNVSATDDSSTAKVVRSVDRKVAAAGKATLGFVSDPAIPAGEPMLITITLADAENLNLVTMDLVYDPELVDFINAAEGAFFGKVGKGGTINVVPAGPGLLKLRLAAGAGVPGVSGEGPLAVLTFRGKKAGPAGFSLDSIQLSGQGGKIQPAVALSSFVDIQ
jgi:general secretion pathway protein D